jgi:hypothetical protein
LIPVSSQRRRISFSLSGWSFVSGTAIAWSLDGMLINRASGDAGRFAEKLTGEQFPALLAAQQRRKFRKYQLRRWNNAQHSGQFRENCERF